MKFGDQLDNRLNFFVIKAGYLPVPIPNFLGCEKKNKCLLNKLKKINPVNYFVLCEDIDDKSRDKNEARIIKWSLTKIPVLGICRGMQVIINFSEGQKLDQ